LNQTITPVFYANQDTKTPVRIGAWMVGLNITLNVILMQFLYHVGLALATSITAIVNYLFLLRAMKKKLPDVDYRHIWDNIAKIASLSVLIFLLLFFANRYFIYTGRLELIIKVTIASCLGFLIFIIGTQVWNVAYSREIRHNLWQKIRRR
jgi:putative peptidoglycan lipid II flippase